MGNFCTSGIFCNSVVSVLRICFRDPLSASGLCDLLRAREVDVCETPGVDALDRVTVVVVTELCLDLGFFSVTLDENNGCTMYDVRTSFGLSSPSNVS
jgi:hypothetical protein